jgi:hypothetical protein
VERAVVVKIRAKYDGKVLVPQEPVALEPNRQYVLAVEGEVATGTEPDEEPDVLAQIVALATDMGVTDLAERHTEYAHERKFGGKLPK